MLILMGFFIISDNSPNPGHLNSHSSVQKNDILYVMRNPQKCISTKLFPRINQHGSCSLEISNITSHDVQAMTFSRCCNETVTNWH